MNYIVIDEDDCPMMLGSYGDTPRTGVLCTGDQVTAFENYGRAYYAIDRTRVYAERKKLQWPTASFKIMRLVPARDFKS
jgi:hypothetical protein